MQTNSLPICQCVQLLAQRGQCEHAHSDDANVRHTDDDEAGESRFCLSKSSPKLQVVNVDSVTKDGIKDGRKHREVTYWLIKSQTQNQ